MKRKALLIINLGSPASTAVKDVKPYLNQFLMDGEVIDYPWLFRFFLVRGIIVPSRVKNSAEAYEKIFTDDGSPLITNTMEFCRKLEPLMTSQFRCVDYAMRYGEPSIPTKLKELEKMGVSKLTVVPMYPQFAKSSTRTALLELQRALKKHEFDEVKVLRDFFEEDAYLTSFARAIDEDIESFNPDHLLLSYHGLPESHVKEFAKEVCFTSPRCCERLTLKNKLCYRAQCFASSRGILSKIKHKIPSRISFQSRLGKQEWLKPYTDKEIELIVQSGSKRLLVACPAFVADCLETLEEIAMRLKEDFIALGGEDLKLVPSLNDRDYWVESFASLVNSSKDFRLLDQVLEEIRSPYS